MKETLRRTMARNVTWRCVAVLDAFALAWIVTRNPWSAAALSVGYNAIQFALHFAHDRVWAHVQWGHEEDRAKPEPVEESGQPALPEYHGRHGDRCWCGPAPKPEPEAT